MYITFIKEGQTPKVKGKEFFTETKTISDQTVEKELPITKNTGFIINGYLFIVYKMKEDLQNIKFANVNPNTL